MQDNQDHITEEEALAQAKADGIEFDDKFEIVEIETNKVMKEYPSWEEADKALEGHDREKYTVLTTRTPRAVSES